MGGVWKNGEGRIVRVARWDVVISVTASAMSTDYTRSAISYRAKIENQMLFPAGSPITFSACDNHKKVALSFTNARDSSIDKRNTSVLALRDNSTSYLRDLLSMSEQCLERVPHPVRMMTDVGVRMQHESILCTDT